MLSQSVLFMGLSGRWMRLSASERPRRASVRGSDSVDRVDNVGQENIIDVAVAVCECKVPDAIIECSSLG